MYFIETRQLGLEPESARKDKQTSNKISNKLPVRALNKLLKTQAGDISPYFLRELIAVMRTEVQNVLVAVEAHQKTIRQAE